MEGFNLTIILLPPLILFSSMDFKHKIIQWNCRGLTLDFRQCGILTSVDSDEAVQPFLRLETPNTVRSVA